MANEIRMVVTAQNKSKQGLTAAKKDVKDLVDEVKKIPDTKTIKVTVSDVDATRLIDKVRKDTIPDKDVKVTADDQASEEIDRIAKTKPAAVKVPVKADVSRIDQNFDDVGRSSAGAFIGGFSGGLLGGGLADIAGNLISGVFEKAGEKAKLASDVQNMMGISPEQARQYGDRIGGMFWSGIGESKDQIASAFGTLSSDVRKWGDLTVDQQDKVVKKAVGVASAFKIDVVEGIRAASSMVDNGLVPSYAVAFDLITKGYQTLGSRADDALDTLTEYSGYFEQLGITGPQALGLIQQGLQAGARDTDFIADAFKEFGILVVENTDKTKDALKGLGLNAKTTQDELRKGGDAAAKATDLIIDKLKAIKDPIKRDEIGLALFGTKWEDTMRQVIGNIDLGTSAVGDFAGATEGLSTGAVTELDKLGRKWDEFASGLGEDVATVINNTDMITGAQNRAIGGLFDFNKVSEEATAGAYAFGVSLDGTTRGFEALADTVGGYASPQFVDMIRKMSDTQLAAQGVTRTVNEVGHTVLTLPNGKQIVIDTNSGRVISDLSGVRSAVNNLPTQKFFTYYMDTVVRGPGPGTAPFPIPGMGRAAGGAVGHAAEGGARSNVTRVNEQGPELGRTQDGVLRDLQTGMTVIPAGQSARMAAAANGGRSLAGGGGGGSGPVTINLVLDRRVLQSVTVDMIRDAVTAKGGNVQNVLGR